MNRFLFLSIPPTSVQRMITYFERIDHSLNILDVKTPFLMKEFWNILSSVCWLVFMSKFSFGNSDFCYYCLISLFYKIPHPRKLCINLLHYHNWWHCDAHSMTWVQSLFAPTAKGFCWWLETRKNDTSSSPPRVILYCFHAKI